MNPTPLATLFCLGLSLNGLTLADEPWRSSWDVTLHATTSATDLTEDSVLNPGNRYAGLAEHAQSAEARINLKLESDALRLTLRPILRSASDTPSRGYLSQWQLRAPISNSTSLSLGREILNWGPAQFRSPSSPFYFDNGRSDPMRELSGVDAVKLAWTPDANLALNLAYVQDSGDAASVDDAWRRTWLAKGELRGDDWTGGLILARAYGRKPFYGAYVQWTLDEAWLMYGEVASATRADALVSSADPQLPFSLQAESARHGIALLGATRTFENGQSLSLEYLRNGHGYSGTEADAYFSRAAANPADAALALLNRPPLLGRHYLHLVWQSNQLEDGDYWRVMWSRNLEDASNEWAGYFEHPLDRHLSVYALGALNDGGARREFAALIENRLQIGIRLALP